MAFTGIFIIWQGLFEKKKSISQRINLMEVLATCSSMNLQIEDYQPVRNPDIPYEINTRYLIKKELGKGAYGTVYLAMDRITGEQ